MGTKSKPRMTEEEKRKKFGKDYDPNWGKVKSNQPKEVPKCNDYKFYAITEQIAKDVGSIPYSYIPGVKFSIPVSFRNTDGTIVTDILQDKVQSCMRIPYVNAIPAFGGSNTGINLAATQLYTKIRQMNSGAKNYEAADSMMYVLAMRDIYAQYFDIKRALGTAIKFSAENRNLPKALTQMLGYNFTDIISNQAQYRARLNILASQINAFKVPKYFNVFQRTAFVNSFIFGDSTSVRGQYYAYVKRGYYVWSGTTSETGTTLVYKDNPPTATRTLQSSLDALQEQLDAIYLDQDATTMSGDIEKAFGEGEMYTVSDTPEGYMVEAVYDEDALNQIENAVTVSAYTGDMSIDQIVSGFGSTLNITQTNQLISFTPSVALATGTVNRVPKAFIFNSHKDNPDYRDNLEWSRNITVGNIGYSTSRGTFVTITSSGLELTLGMEIIQSASTPASTDVPQVMFESDTTTGSILGAIEYFDWHPILYLLTDNDEVNFFGDLKKYTVIQASTAMAINDAAITAAFYKHS